MASLEEWGKELGIVVLMEEWAREHGTVASQVYWNILDTMDKKFKNKFQEVWVNRYQTRQTKGMILK